MPLMHKGSEKAFEHNVKAEMDAHPGKRAQNLAIAYSIKRRAKKMADGGFVGEEEAEYDPTEHESPKENEEAMEEDDMVSRIMNKRQMYSKGGMVANNDEPITDSMPANYDDLALRDELESSYTGANSGDEDGSKLNQEEGDMVSRIMRKRAGRMPHPA